MLKFTCSVAAVPLLLLMGMPVGYTDSAPPAPVAAAAAEQLVTKVEYVAHAG